MRRSTNDVRRETHRVWRTTVAEFEKKIAELEPYENRGVEAQNDVLRAKIKECCGYPLSLPGDFRLSFYWLAWESDYALEPYDTSIVCSVSSGANVSVPLHGK